MVSVLLASDLLMHLVFVVQCMRAVHLEAPECPLLRLYHELLLVRRGERSMHLRRIPRTDESKAHLLLLTRDERPQVFQSRCVLLPPLLLLLHRRMPLFLPLLLQLLLLSLFLFLSLSLSLLLLQLLFPFPFLLPLLFLLPFLLLLLLLLLLLSSAPLLCRRRMKPAVPTFE